MIYTWAHALEVDDTWFGHETKAEAIAEGLHLARECGQEHFYLARALPVNLDDLIDIRAEVLIDTLIEDVADLMPEDCSWLEEVPKEALKELDLELKSTMIAWMTRHNLMPNWFEVGEAEQISVADCAKGKIS